MVWSCRACTFENASDQAWTCEICTAVRPGKEMGIVDLTGDCQSARSSYTIPGETREGRTRPVDPQSERLYAVSTQGGRYSNADSQSARSYTVSARERRTRTVDPQSEIPYTFSAQGGRTVYDFSALAAPPRDANEDPPLQTNRKMTQRNLFGAVVKSPENLGSSKTRKRKNPPGQAVDVVTRAPSQPALASQQKVVRDTSFPSLWQKALTNMKAIFGIDRMRGLQPVAIEGALKRKSQIVVMATGGGKSLCYQLPATVLDGVTIVISPLIALMVDQVQALNDKGVAATLVSSANGARRNNEVMERLLGRPLKTQKKNSKDPPKPKPITILFGTPELVQTERFRNVLIELHKKNRLALFAVDEGHCLSTWGHDFRPAYRKLQWLRTSFPNIPCTVCTATATAKVIEDIRTVLLLPETEVPCHMGSFNRANISYEVRFKDSLDAMSLQGAIGDLVDVVQQQHAEAAKRSIPCSGIIYVHKRQDCEALAKRITKATGIRAAAYHGGLKDAERGEVQRGWTAGLIQLAVATIAFGMGIDLAHVRYVVHWSLAKTVEGFYQESGRAGRDGLPAISVLYFSKDEASKFSYLIQQQNNSKKDAQTKKNSTERSLDALQRMVNYCITPCCRRQYLLAHFGEKVDAKHACNRTCDYCQNPKLVEKRIDASHVVKDVIDTNKRSGNKGWGSPAKWDGQWSKPHGDDDEDDDWQDTWTAGDLEITSYADADDLEADASSVARMPRDKSFGKSASILDKYEAMENRENKGFVRFNSKTSGYASSASDVNPRPVVIPEHLRSNLPDPLKHLNVAKKSTAEVSADSGRLKDELAKLKEQREQTALRLKEMRLKAKAGVPPPPPPPPPPMSEFGKANRKKATR